MRKAVVFAAAFAVGFSVTYLARTVAEVLTFIVDEDAGEL